MQLPDLTVVTFPRLCFKLVGFILLLLLIFIYLFFFLRKMDQEWIIYKYNCTSTYSPPPFQERLLVHVRLLPDTTHAPAPRCTTTPHKSHPYLTPYPLDWWCWGVQWGAELTARLGYLPYLGMLQDHVHLFWKGFTITCSFVMTTILSLLFLPTLPGLKRKGSTLFGGRELSAAGTF